MGMQLEDFDSTEEFHFYHWLLEAEKHELLYNIEYHPEPFILSERTTYDSIKKLKTKTKIVDKFLFHPHKYQPDFKFKAQNKLIFPFFDGIAVNPFSKTIIVDVKGNFGGRNNNSAITFPLNQKWLYQKYGIYVQKVVPEKLFKKTFVPGMARLSPKKKHPVKKYINCKSIREFMS